MRVVAGHGGRNGLERTDKRVVTVQFRVDAVQNLLVRHAALVKLVVERCGLVAGIRHVKRKVLFLRVQHQPYLVAALHERYHLLVLHLRYHIVACDVLFLFVICVGQFGSQHSQCGGQVLFLQHSVRCQGQAASYCQQPHLEHDVKSFA